MTKKYSAPTTIGANPLDRLFDTEAVTAIVGKKRRPGDRPDTAVLTVTVPNALADDLEQIIAVTPGADLDTLATKALRQVLKDMKKKAEHQQHNHLKKSGSKGGPRNAGTKMVVIVND